MPRLSIATHPPHIRSHEQTDAANPLVGGIGAIGQITTNGSVSGFLEAAVRRPSRHHGRARREHLVHRNES
jgi:hypothetical protein